MSKTEFFYRDPDAPVPNRPIGVGVLAVIERGDSLLLERRSDCDRWGLIGGSIEVDETPAQALRREVLEETGLVVVGERLMCVAADPTRIVRYADGNTVRVISFVYKATIEDFDTLGFSDESLDLRFFDPEEFSTLDVIETARPLIEQYLQHGPDVDMLREGEE